MPADKAAPGNSVRGVYAAALTPLDADLGIDLDAFLAHCRWLIARGCDGLAVLGTTGEANSFTVEERIALIEALAASDIAPDCLLVGTGCASILDSAALTRRALAHGFARVLVLPPFYYKTVSDDGLFAAFAEIIEREGDDRLRLYLYHFPRMSGIGFSPALIARLLAAYPGTVAGLKDSSGDIGHARMLCREFPGFEVFAGSEALLVDILEAGGAGCIGAGINLTATPARRAFTAWRGADIAAARRAQAEVSAIRRILDDYPMIPALKATLARHAEAARWRHIRPPLVPLGPDAAAGLAGRLAAAGLDLAPAD